MQFAPTFEEGSRRSRTGKPLPPNHVSLTGQTGELLRPEESVVRGGRTPEVLLCAAMLRVFNTPPEFPIDSLPKQFLCVL
jgi:hypothetical protein